MSPHPDPHSPRWLWRCEEIYREALVLAAEPYGLWEKWLCLLGQVASRYGGEDVWKTNGPLFVSSLPCPEPDEDDLLFVAKTFAEVNKFGSPNGMVRRCKPAANRVSKNVYTRQQGCRLTLEKPPQSDLGLSAYGWKYGYADGVDDTLTAVSKPDDVTGTNVNRENIQRNPVTRFSHREV